MTTVAFPNRPVQCVCSPWFPFLHLCVGTLLGPFHNSLALSAVLVFPQVSGVSFWCLVFYFRTFHSMLLQINCATSDVFLVPTDVSQLALRLVFRNHARRLPGSRALFCKAISHTGLRKDPPRGVLENCTCKRRQGPGPVLMVESGRVSGSGDCRGPSELTQPFSALMS